MAECRAALAWRLISAWSPPAAPRALKKIIRARAAKTGERYTTARRHVLSQIRSSASSAASATPPSPAPATKGVLSDVATREKTGRSLDHWFHVLEAFGGISKGHTALARHLRVDHGVPSWYCQMIAVTYERANGRPANQRCDGVYEISVSKTIPAPVQDVIARVAEQRQRTRWADRADENVVTALVSGLTAPKSKGIVVRSNGQARLRYKWGDTTVQIYFYPKPGGKTSMVVTHSGLASSEMVAARRSHWRATLDAIARSTA